MVGVVDQKSVVIEKHRLRFLERNAVLSAVCGSFSGVPLEPEVAHTYSITTT